MRYPLVVAILSVPWSLWGQTQSSAAKPAAPLPRVAQNGAAKQMFVDGKPFLMLAGELHNSSASSTEYMKPIWALREWQVDRGPQTQRRRSRPRSSRKRRYRHAADQGVSNGVM